MAREFRLPDIGEGLTEAEVVRWLVAVGDRVEVDQAVVEVETDKAVVELPCPFGGVVLHHGAAEGEVVEVGSVLVVVGDEGESWPEATGEETPEPEASSPTDEGHEPAAEEVPAAAPIVGSLDERADTLTGRAAEPSGGEETTRPRALPVVRKLARDLGVDLGEVTGTGPDGRVTREDVERAAGGAPPRAEVPEDGGPAEPSGSAPATQIRPGGERRRLSRLRRTIAANMSRSWAEIPHVTTFDQVDATRLLAARRALEARHGVPVSIDALVAKAVMPALAAHPEFNASLDGEDLVVPEGVDLGLAVDTPDGLLVAVIRRADRMGLLDLAAAVDRAGRLGRERGLGPDELSGQTFTLSNIGAVGGGLGTPIVPPGTTAILSIGRAVDTPVARDGRVEIAPMMPLSLSYDHRVIDGGLGRRFMALVLENIVEPALFLAG